MSPESSEFDGKTPKYAVTKADGSPTDPEALYLVLRIDGKRVWDPEIRALAEYLRALENRSEDGAALARHLRAYFGRPDL